MKKFNYMDEVFNRNPIYRSYSPAKQKWIKFKFLLSRTFKNTALIDYVQYNFFLLNGDGRDRFISQKKRRIIRNKLNNKDKLIIFDDKDRFNKDFSQYIGRSSLDLAKASQEEVESFMADKKNIMLKPVEGSFGVGITKIACDDSGLKKVLEDYRGKDYIIEEYLVQDKELAEFNDSSFNTLRVLTLIDDKGEPDVIAAVLRMGRKGKFVDNFHYDGISALIDHESGVVKTTGTDQYFNRYTFHPDSNKQIVGFKIPHWDKVIRTVKEAAMIHPDMRYVGWDIGVREDGSVVIIEGNHSGDPDVIQRTDLVGKWHLFSKYID